LPEGGNEGFAWLQERKKPEDLIVVGELYGDPTTVET
jgi:cysteamine dioxygenase